MFVSAHVQLVNDDQPCCCNTPHFLGFPLDRRISVFRFSILAFLILLQFRFHKPAAVTRFPWISFLSRLQCSTGGEQGGLLQVELMVTPMPETVAQYFPL